VNRPASSANQLRCGTPSLGYLHTEITTHTMLDKNPQVKYKGRVRWISEGVTVSR